MMKVCIIEHAFVYTCTQAHIIPHHSAQFKAVHCHLTDFCGQRLENRLQTEQP